MAKARRVVTVKVNKESLSKAWFFWKKHLEVSSLKGAMVLALHILFLYYESVRKGYTEIFLVDDKNQPIDFLSTDEILWEYGQKRFNPCGELVCITFSLPPVYVYSLMPAMMEHLGIEDHQSILMLALALLELYAHAKAYGMRIEMIHPESDSTIISAISSPGELKQPACVDIPRRWWPSAN